MTIRNREEAAQAAERTHTNTVGACQAYTHRYYDPSGALAVGDRDHDRDADANDGWRSEPESARHYGDRKPPRGVPLYFKNRHKTGPRAFGHRCISEGDHNGIARSTDFANGRYTPGVVGTGTIEQIEAAMDLEYVGWSSTISGREIPLPPPPAPTRVDNFLKGGPQWNVKILDRAAEGRDDVKRLVHKIDVAVNHLPRDKTNSRVKQFVDGYKKDRILRMGLLNAAVKAGRRGQVKDVRDELRHLIHTEAKKLAG